MCIQSTTLLLVLTMVQGAGAFVAHSIGSARIYETSVSAVAPTFIIGPMIRKMREEKEKKKMPMAAPDEAAYEAPGLRVGKSAWKWPPVWPYDMTSFVPKQDEVAPAAPDLASVASMMNGAPQVPPSLTVSEESKLDPIKYWGEEKADVATELSEGAAAKLRNHYSFYLKDGMSVLELGAAEESYLPEGLKLARHVGVGASQTLMDKNPALTEALVVNLNDVEEEKGVNSEDLRRLSAEPFDAIIMANTIDFLTNPREVFKSAWYLLKPGGVMIVPFSSKDAYTSKFESAQTKVWRSFNDDQHMWVCGSFFHFSAGEGWENLRGFDISPEGSKKLDEDGPLSFLNGGANTNLYVVQADKAMQADDIDPVDPEQSFKSKMWMLPIMENRDKMMVAPRLRRAYELIPNSEFLAKQVDFLPAVYEPLIKMDQFAFTFSMQAQLAVDLVSDPDFCANDDQMNALKQGLGLRTPSKEFWEPVGQLTSAMNAEDKVNLLAHLVPRFGSGVPSQDEALAAFVSGMRPTFVQIRLKCPSLTESDVQLLGTELLAAEVLKPGRSSREDFAKWLAALTEVELTAILNNRKKPKLEANAELGDFRRLKDEKERKEREQQEKLRAQVEAARKGRTLEFDARTGKFELATKK